MEIKIMTISELISAYDFTPEEIEELKQLCK